jgi:uncharacterized membrane protein
MNKLIPIGRTFFALAFIGLGIEHFVFQEFIAGRAPAWPEAVPGRQIWAYLTGGVLVLSSAAILIGMRTRSAAMTMGALIFAWALLRHIPVLVSTSLLSGAWTHAGKALVFVGGALAIAATAPKLEGGPGGSLSRLMNLGGELVVVGRVCLGMFLVLTGIQHFMFTEFVASLIPGWFPGDAVFWTYFAGVALIAGGIGLLVPMTARVAALLSGLMIFSWFWIVHLPRTFEGVSDSIAVFEALAVSGIALVLAGYRGGPVGRVGARL